MKFAVDNYTHECVGSTVCTSKDALAFVCRQACSRLYNRRPDSRITPPPRVRDVRGLVSSAWYNLCRKHEAIQGQTPAMAAGITGKVWTIRELLKWATEV